MRRPVIFIWVCIPLAAIVLLGAASIPGGAKQQSLQVLFELRDQETLRLLLESNNVCDDLTIHGSTLNLTMDCPRANIRLSGTGELRYGTILISFDGSEVEVANLSLPLRKTVIPLRPGSFVLKRDGTIVQKYYSPAGKL